MSAISLLTEVCSSWDSYQDAAIASGKPESPSESILITPFWNEGFCSLVIAASEEHGKFGPLYADTLKVGAAPGQELRVNEFCPALFEMYKKHISRYIAPKLCNFYRMPYLFDREWDVFRMPFLVRYTMSSQRSMEEHHDASILSLSVKLSDPATFEGTDLVFTRQNWSNKEVGHGMAVWFPGQLTHPHYANELQSGCRYGMTGWIRGSNLKDIEP